MLFARIYGTAIKALTRPVIGASLGIFRIGFGVICFVETIRLAGELDGNSPNDIVNFELLFKFQFFQWVDLLPEPWLWGIVYGMKAAAVLIAIGLLYRLAIWAYCAGYCYFFLVEMSHYNNHYYMLILMLVLLGISDANRCYSLDRLFKFSRPSPDIGNWQLILIRFQVVWVYLCAGLVKLNAEWLSGRTMRAALYKGADFESAASFFQSDFMVWFYTWTGLFFDLFIGVLLLWKKTRWPAVILLLVFHSTNAITLSIGIFPYLMLWATILFFKPSWPQDILAGRIPAMALKHGDRANGPSMKPFVLPFITLYVAVQLALPARHHLIRGYVDWTGEGITFAWRMKSAGRSGDWNHFAVYVYDRKTGEELKPELYLSDRQQKFILFQPALLLQLRDHLADKMQRSTRDLVMRADIVCSLNGSKYMPLVDPEADLCRYEVRRFRHNDFITLYFPATGRYIK